ncbi:hypothetical protein ACVWU4_001018 [Campylobacter coli]
MELKDFTLGRINISNKKFYKVIDSNTNTILDIEYEDDENYKTLMELAGDMSIASNNIKYFKLFNHELVLDNIRGKCNKTFSKLVLKNIERLLKDYKEHEKYKDVEIFYYMFICIVREYIDTNRYRLNYGKVYNNREEFINIIKNKMETKDACCS